MLFNSEQFIIFLPIVVLVYYIVPHKIQYIWLLITSYFFYMCWNAKYAFLLLFITLVTYISAIIIDKNRKNRKTILCLCILFTIGLLIYYKYLNFGLGLISAILNRIHIMMYIPTFDIILPVGISFFTFQALGYVIDVYRGEINVEKNVLKYCLFVSFFPQLVAGPIERSGNLIKQLDIPRKFSMENLKIGVYLMTWGFFLKIVIADRIALFVDTVYAEYNKFYGWYIIVATVLFSVQIYCDFYGYSTIAKGAAKVLGIELMENFDAPYLSLSVTEFWRKWHISLTSWFKDYVYIPLGGNKRGNVRKNINKIIVFLISGLWHGANLAFVIWGGLNGLFQVIESGLKPIDDRLHIFLHLDRSKFSNKIARMIITFLVVDFSWIFFRASYLGTSIDIIKHIFYENNIWILFDGSLYKCGIDEKNFIVIMVSVSILLFADIMKHKKISIIEAIDNQEWWFKCLFIPISVWLILIFGIWGPGYDAVNFIYFQF